MANFNERFYMFSKLNGFNDNATRWPSDYLSIYICGHEMDFKLKVMLRSTTGPYGRPM